MQPSNIHKTIKLKIEHWIINCYWKYMGRSIVSLQALVWDAEMQHHFCIRRDIARWVKKAARIVYDSRLDNR